MRTQSTKRISLLSGSQGAAQEASDTSEPPAALSLAPAKLLADFPGPALICDAHGQVLSANARGADLAAALAGAAEARLRALLARAASRLEPLMTKARLDKAGVDGGTVLDLTLVPLVHGEGVRVLVLGRDATLERNLTNALAASRELFRDLVQCSSDFAWETGRDGAFGFVSARGALGYSARELNGRPARDLLHAQWDDGSLPFESSEPLEDVEVWVRRADGAVACLLTSAVPVHGEAAWEGLRAPASGNAAGGRGTA